jgi:hypothetical protein
MIIMKTVVFAFFLLCASAAFGQSAPVLPNTAQPVAFVEHPAQAAQHDMGRESYLYNANPYTYAQGEQPLWQFGSAKQEVPLGDVARAYRKDHAISRKASVVVEK